MKRLGHWACFALLAAGVMPAAAAEWKPAEGKLMTRWAAQVTPENAHAEYPRPQMTREQWQNLNGLWQYAVRPKDEDRPAAFDGEILVPFPIESALSGVMKPVTPQDRLWYRRTVMIPADWKGQRVLLHFGAVDWETTVWVNGREVGSHRGGYDPFVFDISKALQEGENELLLAVWDPTSEGYQPRGKQVLKPGGIWYTAVTGIWQTAWLEPVPQASIAKLLATPDLDAGCVRLTVNTSGAEADDVVVAEVLDGEKVVGSAEAVVGQPLSIAIAQPKLWTPDTPFLYGMQVKLARKGKTVDAVESYVGMRKISIGKDENGITRILLNGKFVFQYGPLDQGWWPDGLYTAASDEALRYDLEVLKEIGCNMLRKHVKVEPDRYYYWCDKLGLLVWQDMPSGDRYIGGDDPDIQRTKESGEQYELELSRMIAAFENHPSIVMWVPYNEGWGQWDTARIVEMIRKLDPTRLVNNASGWTDRRAGDVHDIHNYPGPAIPALEEERAVVLGEFGGLGLPLAGHTWQAEKNWGYRSFESREALSDAYVALMHKLHPLVGKGLSAAVYTQTSDVEIEVNGWLTYDRAVLKIDAATMGKANRQLYLPPPVVKNLVPTSREQAQTWRYTTTAPAEGWLKPDFDDSAWTEAPGGFGEPSTPGSVVKTPWKTSDIWLRRTFDLAAVPAEPQLEIHHDEDAEVFINGVPAGSFTGYVGDYFAVPIASEACKALRAGKNVLAIHCRQTGGGQYIDAGLSEVVPAKP